MSAQAASPVVEARGLVRIYRQGAEAVRAVAGVDLTVAPGELVAITGRSGSGKTTLLNLIAGLDRPTEGRIVTAGYDLSALHGEALAEFRRRQIGFVFQGFGLLPLLSAFENVELPLRMAGVPWRERERRAAECLEMVGLTPRSRHRPFELSGGEQQRVAIARAVANRPALIVADEPTGELDYQTALSIFDLFRRLVKTEGVTVVAATHDTAILDAAARTLELRDGAWVNAAVASPAAMG